MPQWASFQDVRDDYEGDIGTDQLAWVERLINRAERLLVARVPSLPRRYEQGSVAKENIVDAVVSAVLRVVRNPEGMQSETEGSYLYSVQRDVAGGKLFFTGDDLALLRPAPSGVVGAPIRSSIPCWRSHP